MDKLTNDTVFSSTKIKQFFILATILFIGIILYLELHFMLSAFLGAFTLYILLMKPLKKLTGGKHKWKKGPAALFLMTCSVIVLLAPIYFIIRFVLAKISPYLTSPEPLINGINTINKYISSRFDFTLLSPENLDKIKELGTKILPKIIGSGLLNISELLLLYFILWYLLTNSYRLEHWIRANSPFKPGNTSLLVNETKKSIVNNSIGIVILGIIQGIAAIIGYYIFGVDEPILWGLITGAASVIPFAGTMAVWVPIAILLFAKGETGAGIGLSLWGLFLIGGIDNVLRFILQKYMGQTHPIITVLGVIIGINLFGFWGLIFGPLLITIFILLGGIYKKEYLAHEGEGVPVTLEKESPA